MCSYAYNNNNNNNDNVTGPQAGRQAMELVYCVTV